MSNQVGMRRNLTNYGAFIEIEEGIDGLLHVSDMSWTSNRAARTKWRESCSFPARAGASRS